jgi:hypothetical protein
VLAELVVEAAETDAVRKRVAAAARAVLHVVVLEMAA